MREEIKSGIRAIIYRQTGSPSPLPLSPPLSLSLSLSVEMRDGNQDVNSLIVTALR